jgi:hypothetical protein
MLVCAGSSAPGPPTWCGAHPPLRRASASPLPSSRLLHGPLCCLLGGRVRAPGRHVPTVNVVREQLEISPSSSSSRVWNLGIEPLSAGHRGNRAVGALWAGDRLPVSTRGQLDCCAPSLTCLHPSSPGHAQGRPHPVPRGPSGRRAGSTASSAGCGQIRPGRWTSQVRGLPAGAPGRATSGVRHPAAAGDRYPQPVHSPGDKATSARTVTDQSGRSVTVRSLTGATLDPGGQLGDLRVRRPALAHQAGDLLHRVHDRGVVLAAEGGADPRQ